MAQFFKGAEERPFTYQTIIEERKQSKNYVLWTVCAIFIIAIVIGLFKFFF